MTLKASRFSDSILPNNYPKHTKKGSQAHMGKARMKQDCFSCRADGDTKCLLGYKTELIKSKALVDTMKPLEMCSKPKTWKDFEKEKKKRGINNV